MLPVSDSNVPYCLSGPRTDEPAKPPPIDPGGMWDDSYITLGENCFAKIGHCWTETYSRCFTYLKLLLIVCVYIFGWCVCYPLIFLL